MNADQSMTGTNASPHYHDYMSPDSTAHSRKKALRSREQLLLKLGVFLLLGAIINVTVAWGCIWFSSARSFSDSDEVVAWIATFSKEGIEATSLPDNVTQFGWQRRPDTEWFRYCVLVRTSSKSGFKAWTLVEDVSQVPGRSTSHLPPDNIICSTTLVGLPALSMATEQWTDYDAPYSTIPHSYGAHIIHPQRFLWGLPIPKKATFLGSTRTQAVQLPLCPVWPGFAINTIFYAALLWVLWMTPGKIRRLVRIRGGRCPACGYQIAPGTGGACSECGELLSPQRGAGV